jgi:hypothetical protein
MERSMTIVVEAINHSYVVGVMRKQRWRAPKCWC